MNIKRVAKITIFIVSITVIAAFIIKAIQINHKISDLQLQLTELEQAILQYDQDQFDQIILKFHSIENVYHQLESEVTTLAPLLKNFGWLPIYGEDLRQVELLISQGDILINISSDLLSILTPTIEKLESSTSSKETNTLTIIANLELDLSYSENQLAEYNSLRGELEIDGLSPRTKEFVTKMDFIALQLSNAISILQIIPEALGATEYGPTNYLLLAQNEDELRATGGFITAVAIVTVDNGKVTEIDFENSKSVDDPDQIYAYVPWQMAEYMDLGLWYLRDANWSPNYPTVATYAASLMEDYYKMEFFAVIAFDQKSISMILEAIGPVKVGNEIITNENLADYLREKKGIREDYGNQNEYRENKKDFLKPLGETIISEIINNNVNLGSLLQTTIEILNEKHLLIYSTNPDLQALIENSNWDGAIRRGSHDYLLIVDSNLGYNKSNVKIKQSFIYKVDLSDPFRPQAELKVTHENKVTKSDVLCFPRAGLKRATYSELINQCHWNYLRYYPQIGTELVNAIPHDVQGENMLLGIAVPARIDILSPIDGGFGFGTFLMVPTDSEITTSFFLDLPKNIIEVDPIEGIITYELIIQKQAGTHRIESYIEVILPPEALIIEASINGEQVENVWRTSFFLNTDKKIILKIQLPK